ncbi:ATP-binding protein [Candidatus Micrarchaeota archaeon]|nr:ATP-binding protein [Candidatus Micrarchaeota archaeon]
MLGRIIATEEGPTPSQFCFLSSARVDKNSFVEYELDGGRGLAMITDLRKDNRYYSEAENVHQSDRAGVDLSARFPTGEWEYLLATCQVHGLLKDGRVLRATTAPSPGTKVGKAGNDLLQVFLGFEQGGLHIGSVEHHDLDVRVPVSRLFQKHVAILAMSGAGKSYLTSVILEELLSRKQEQTPAVVLVDVHGEYSSLADDTTVRGRVRVIRGEDLKLPVSSLSPHDFFTLIPDASAPQKRELRRVIEEARHAMREGSGPYDMQELVKRVENDSKMNELVAEALVAWLSGLDATNLFDKHGMDVAKLANVGNLSILDLGEMIDSRKKQMILSYIAGQLFNKRRANSIPPFLLIVEEAHQFCREGATSGDSLSRDIIETIAREGRKFGASLCLISQRPIQLSTTALSQCNSVVILRVTNPYDIKHIGESCEALDRSSLDSITTLQVGEALIVGEAVRFPLFIKVRQRRSQESRPSKTLEEMAGEFASSRLTRAADAAAFM